MKINKKQKIEKVGSKYKIIQYAVFSRKVGTERWHSFSRYSTLEEAKRVMNTALKGPKNQSVCSDILLNFIGNDSNQYERKLVKIVNHCEVLQVGIGPM